ncbi:MAG: nuclease-related domain-containing protein [Anaerolineaceae bacterium]|nr:nuclease-related domain-containing protein [Anaerolineaceae bacterium]
MKTIIDQVKITKRAKISNIASLGGMLLMVGCAGYSIFRPDLSKILIVGIVVGAGISMVGIYFANRWVKKPRPEASLDGALKNLSEGYRIYHYPAFPCDHILLTPSGVVLLETVNLDGVFIYKDGHWKEKMSIGRAMRYIVEEYLGNPIKSVQSGAQLLRDRLKNELTVDGKVPVTPLVVFTHPHALIEIHDAPIPVIPVIKLKKQIPSNLPKMSPELYQEVQALLDKMASLS